MQNWNSIKGYMRADGRWGCRNLVVVLAAADNVNPLATQLVAANEGTTLVCATFGRGQLGADFEITLRSLAGFATHPNVFGCLVVCYEREAGEKIAARCGLRRESVQVLSILETGGLGSSLERGSTILREMQAKARALKPESVPVETLTVGLECGGSDATSGLFANPAIGVLADKLHEQGATLLFSEPVELVGCEAITDARAVSKEVAEDIRSAINTYVDIARDAGIDLVETNPTPDNMAGGLSTIEEKSLGAITKTGTRPIEGVLPYGETAPGPGIWLVDAPAAAVENLTALAAAGCQVILFATGTVNPTGNPVSPTIKICANPLGIRSMGEHVDVDLSAAHDGSVSVIDAAEPIEQALIDTINGKLTVAESLGYLETRISRVGPSV